MGAAAAAACFEALISSLHEETSLELPLAVLLFRVTITLVLMDQLEMVGFTGGAGDLRWHCFLSHSVRKGRNFDMILRSHRHWRLFVNLQRTNGLLVVRFHNSSQR